MLSGVSTEKESEIRLFLSLRFNLRFHRILFPKAKTMSHVLFWCHIDKQSSKNDQSQLSCPVSKILDAKSSKFSFSNSVSKKSNKVLVSDFVRFGQEKLVGVIFFTSGIQKRFENTTKRFFRDEAA